MNKDGLILHLCVVADTHIDILHPDPERPKRHLFNAIKDSRSAQPPMDAFIIVGDTTSRSSEINWEMTEEVFKKAGRPAKRTLIAIGNHDTWCDEEDKTAIERYLRHTCNITGEKHEKTYFSTIINGCHLIFLGAEDDNGCEAYISDEQAEWFRDEMASAGESRLPVLVFCHQSLNGKHGLPRTFSCDESDTGEMDGGIGEKSGFIEKVGADNFRPHIDDAIEWAAALK